MTILLGNPTGDIGIGLKKETMASNLRFSTTILDHGFSKMKIPPMISISSKFLTPTSFEMAQNKEHNFDERQLW